MQTAKLIRDGQDQAVRLPKEFHFSGRTVFIKRLGSAVILLPKGETWADHQQSVTGFDLDVVKKREKQKKRTRASVK
jgi:antitoxin VapB